MTNDSKEHNETDESQNGNWQVVEAEFELSCYSLNDLPTDGLPEFAFVGRSNVGKSSLLNSLCVRRALARVSKTPGRTQAINMFMVRIRDAQSGAEVVVRFADLPGYGYAKVAAQVQESWRVMLGEYLQQREPLTSIIVVHDSRRELAEEEAWFFTACDVPAFLVATKIDKIPKSKVKHTIKGFAKQLDVDDENVFSVSLLKANHPNVLKLLRRIVEVSLQEGD